MAQKNTNKSVQQAKAQAQQNSMEETLNKWEAFFEENKNKIIIAVCALVVVVVAIFLYKAKVVEPRETRVAESMYQAEEYFMNEQYSQALNGDEFGNMGMMEIADNNGGTKAGKLAAAYAGICLAHLDSCDLAIKYLSKFNGKDQMVGPAALGTLADCYANTNQNSKAASTFLKAAKKADNDLLTPYYMFQAGLIYEAEAQPAQALKLYKQIKSEYPGSQEASVIDSYIKRLSSK